MLSPSLALRIIVVPGIVLLGTSIVLATGTDDSWTFDQPRSAWCFTLEQVVKDGEPILYVTHDADDHAWQFLTGGLVSSDDSMIVSMAEIVELDPSLLEIGYLPPGYSATRDTVDGEWSIRRTSDPDVVEIPDFLQDIIVSLESEPPESAPEEIWQFILDGQTVFYISPRYCCDLPSILYDAAGNLICHPDGGVVGAGDGKCLDFFRLRTDGIRLWRHPGLSESER